LNLIHIHKRFGVIRGWSATSSGDLKGAKESA
jgi:hypothetical protein